jgi:hypothetical protein
MDGRGSETTIPVFGVVAAQPDRMWLADVLDAPPREGVVLRPALASAEAVMVLDANSREPADVDRFAAALIKGANNAKRMAELWRKTA